METRSAVCVHQVLVIGAGPSGIAAAIELSKCGIQATVVDQHGEVGGAFRRMYPSLILTTPRQLLELPDFPILEASNYVTAAVYGRYLANVAERCHVTATRGRVVAITQENQWSTVTLDDGQSVLARVVVVATGMSDHPRIPSYVSGSSTSSRKIVHSGEWNGPASIAGPRVIVVGRRLRAIELAEECASAGYQVFISARGGKLSFLPKSFWGKEYRHYLARLIERLPLWLTRSYCERGVPLRPFDQGCKRFLKSGAIKVIPEVCDIVDEGAVTSDGKVHSFDSMVLATGFALDMSFLPRTVPLTALGMPFLRDGQCADAPGIFFLGLPCCFKIDSQFIQGIRRDAAVLAHRIAMHLRGQTIQVQAARKSRV